MRYDLDLSDTALDDLRRLPTPIRRYTVTQLEGLGEHPTLLSESARFPNEMEGQVCVFDYDFEQENWMMRILFNYSEDERRLIIVRIRYLRQMIE